MASSKKWEHFHDSVFQLHWPEDYPQQKDVLRELMHHHLLF